MLFRVSHSKYNAQNVLLSTETDHLPRNEATWRKISACVIGKSEAVTNTSLCLLVGLFETYWLPLLSSNIDL